MRYPVKSMSTLLSTDIVSANSLRLSSGVKGSYGTSNVSDDIVDYGERSTERRPRWKNTPGIQVSLQSLEQEPQIDEYRRLQFDGRRKEFTRVTELKNINQTVDVEQFDEGNTRSERSVNPRTNIILDSFIQQMGGAEQSLSSGSTINTSV